MPNDKPHAVPGSEKDRADGWYWVKWFKSAPWVATDWTTNVDSGGEWLEDYPEHDSPPFEIGPRIPSPDEQPVPVEPDDSLTGTADDQLWSRGEVAAIPGVLRDLTATPAPVERPNASVSTAPIAWLKYALDLEAQVRELQADKERR